MHLSVEDAIKLQQKMAKDVVKHDVIDQQKIKHICGVDVSYRGNKAFSCAVVIERKSLAIVDSVCNESRVESPYISGLLFLREAEPVLAVLEKLEHFYDLLMVDGGKGQLNVAVTVLKELGLSEVEVIALAKMRTEREPAAEAVRHSDERVFMPGRKNPVILRQNSTALFLLQRVRDEAHRFAITYHRELRRKERLSSPLDEVPGVGEARRKALLRHFGSLKRVQMASAEELMQVPGIAPSLAEAIHHYLASSSVSVQPSTLLSAMDEDGL